MRNGMMKQLMRHVAAMGAVALAMPLVASAQIAPGSIYKMSICQGGNCLATYDIEYNAQNWQPDGSYLWQLDSDVDLFADGSTDRVATLLASSGSGTFLEIVPPGIAGRATPQVNLGFAVQAGSTDTQFTVQSAEMTFPTITNAEGRASATFSLGDGFDDGATMTGLLGNSKAYEAQYNGFVPNGTLFAGLIDPMALVPNGGTIGQVEDFPGGGGYSPIGVPVDSMSAIASFEVTANDFVSGTSTFEIIPEPASLLLLALGGVVLRRR